MNQKKYLNKLVFLKHVFRHARVRFKNARFRPSKVTSSEMIRGLITGLYPDLIQNAFFSSSVFIGSKCFWQTTQDKLISMHGSGKGFGTRNLGQAKALEPFARAKQKPWSHEPGSSKGSGTICLGQAKMEGKLKGQKAGTELRTPTCGLQSPHSSVLRVR